MHYLPSSSCHARYALLIAALLGLSFIAVGCGGGSSPVVASIPTPTPTPVPTSTVQLRVGDAPADQLVNFEVTIVSPVVATLSSGEKINSILSDNRIELSHTASKFEPLLNISLPQGTYKSVDITLADPAVTYVYTPMFFGDSFRSRNHELVSQDFPGTQTVTVTFTPPVTFGNDASVINLDVNIAGALVFNPHDGQEITDVKFTPENFAFTKNAIAAADKQQHDDGELESVRGTVSAVNGNSFTISTGQSGALLNIATTSTTQFHDSVKGLADMVDRIVEVEGYTQPDGSMVATEVEGLVSNKGASIEGVILDAGDSLIDLNVLSLGHQSKSFTILAQDGTGNGTKNDDVGWTFTVHTDYLTDQAYEVDYGKCDWTGLGTDVPGPLFPFDSRHLFPGQRVAVVTSSALPGADFSHFTASGVELEQQAITGEIVYYHAPADDAESIIAADNGTWFLLYLPEDSYVRALSGRAFVLVYQGPATDIEYLPTNTDQKIGVGTVARVRGLLFAFANWYPKNAPMTLSRDGGTMTMIARRVTEQKPAEPIPTLTK